jgi:hypothetical protein
VGAAGHGTDPLVEEGWPEVGLDVSDVVVGVVHVVGRWGTYGEAAVHTGAGGSGIAPAPAPVTPENPVKAVTLPRTTANSPAGPTGPNL